MSIPLPRAVLLTLFFLAGNFMLQALIRTLPALAPGLFFGPAANGVVGFPAFKLLLGAAFVIPLAAVFLIQKQSPGRFFRPEKSDATGVTPRALLPTLLTAPLIAASMLILGTELLNFTRTWVNREDQYAAMMRFIGPDGTGLDMFGALLTIGLVGPVCEELLFRGILLRGIEARYRARGAVNLAVLTQALFFALVHLNRFQFPYALGAGIVLGYLAWWTGSILLPLAVHVLINTTQIAILYFFPHTPWFAYNGLGVIEHIPWYAVIAAAICLTVILRWIRRPLQPSAPSTL